MSVSRLRIAALVVASAAVAIYPSTAQGAPPSGSVTVQLGVTGTPRFAEAVNMQPGEVREVTSILAPGVASTLAGTHSHIEDKFYRPGAETHIGATDPEAALAVVQADVGQKVDFDVDGGHQVVVYQVPPGMSFDDAYAYLDGLVVDGGTMTFGPAGTVAATQTTLTQRDADTGFVYLGSTSLAAARAALLVSDGSWTPSAAGKYVALCNVAGHYQAFDMRARIQVH